MLPALHCVKKSLPAAGLPGVFLLLILGLLLSGRLVGSAQNAAGRDAARHQRILVLFNEARDTSGNITLQEAFQAELQKLTTNRMDFFEEYLYARHFTDQAHFQLFQDYLGKKYAGQNLDLIMVFPAGDYALAGALPEALFPNVPVVFVTANELEVPYAISKLGVTGIIQRFDIRGTLGLIMRLQPDTRRVVVVGGSSESDRASLGRIQEIAQGLEGIEIDFWTNRPVAELPAAAKALPAGTVILLSTMQRDVSGQPYFMSQVAQLLVPSASVPIYVLGGLAVGSGVVGGAVVDSEKLGTRGGQLAYRVLNGVKPESVPIAVETHGTPMVDWRALRRWHISESQVPAGCVVRYRPVSLWEEHRDLILGSLAVFLAQALTIAGLLAQRKKRRLAEAQTVKQRAELAHVSRVSTMGQLATALAHELHQPLGAILKNAEAAEIFLQKEPPNLEEVRAILEDIRKDDRRAGNVIHRMRSFLKRRSVELKSLDLADLLRETVTLAEYDARTRQMNISLQLHPNLPAVRGDRMHLQQVLLNLILNGLDAMAGTAKEERLLTVRAEMVKNGEVQVSLSDCGTGISPGKLKHLFEPFFTTKPDGMGMGLAISQSIIEAHGGKIWAANNDRRGAVFKFTLTTDDGAS
jgi:signal transduction histidine kinase